MSNLNNTEVVGNSSSSTIASFSINNDPVKSNLLETFIPVVEQEMTKILKNENITNSLKEEQIPSILVQLIQLVDQFKVGGDIKLILVTFVMQKALTRFNINISNEDLMGMINTIISVTKGVYNLISKNGSKCFDCSKKGFWSFFCCSCMKNAVEGKLPTLNKFAINYAISLATKLKDKSVTPQSIVAEAYEFICNQYPESSDNDKKAQAQLMMNNISQIINESNESNESSSSSNENSSNTPEEVEELKKNNLLFSAELQANFIDILVNTANGIYQINNVLKKK